MAGEETPLIEVTDAGLRQTVSRWTPVEVLVILHTVAVIITVPVQSYYVIDETAKKYGQNHITRHADLSCHPSNFSNVSHTNDSSLIIQKEATEILMYLGFCSSFGSIVPIFIFGYLSDYIGRRIVWIISVSGTLIKELILLLTILLHLPIWVLYIGQIIFALTGTYGGAMVSIFATVADVTPPGKSRSFRITVVQGTGMLTASATIFCMGYWIWTEKYYEPTIMALFISLLSIIFSIFILKDSSGTDSKRKELLGPLKIYLRNASNQNRRRKMLLCLCIFLLSSSCLIGKLEYQTLFLMHKPVCWNEFSIQVMHAVQTLVNTLCVIGIVRLLLRFTHDTVILIAGSISGVVSMVIFGAAVDGYMVYIRKYISCLTS